MRFVGGAVRNSLMGLPVADFDLATIYTPEEIQGFFQSHGVTVIPTGIAHGTVTLVYRGRPYEVTTLRHDVQTDGRWAKVAYTQDWDADAQRRDFTMNALYVDHQGRLHDPVGGVEDIKKGIVRFIGDPAQRIQEDVLRILRFFRFWAWYGRVADAASLQACCALYPQMRHLSGERITKEMVRLVQAPHARGVIQQMASAGILAEALGTDVRAQEVWGVDVWQGDFMTAGIDDEISESTQGPCGLLSLQPDAGGWNVSGFAQGVLDSEMARAWTRLAVLCADWPKRLVLSRSQSHFLRAVMQPLDLQVCALVPALYGHTRQIWIARLLVQACWQNMESQGQRLACAIESQSWPPFPLTGQDLFQAGVRGPAIGQALNRTQSWWVDHVVTAFCQMRGEVKAGATDLAGPDRDACLAWALTHVTPPLGATDSLINENPQSSPVSER